MKITVRVNDREEVREYDHPVTPEEIIQGIGKTEYKILAARVNSNFERLDQPIYSDSTVDLYDLRNPYANMSFQISLVFLYIKAVHDICGRKARLTIENSLSKGLYTTVRSANVADDFCEAVQKRMYDLTERKLIFYEQKTAREDLITMMETYNMRDELALVESATDLKYAYFCEIGEEKEVSFIHLLPHSGYLNHFEVRKYRNGYLLRFPSQMKPDELMKFEEQRLLYDAFSEEYRWERLMRVTNASELNRRIQKGESLDLVMLSEALHERRIVEIAEMICERNSRIILIAGPSSSGKTSFAKRLSVQLRVAGLNPLYLGTDDYFLDRSDMVPDENGEYDFEALEVVDIPLFTEQMNSLLSGKKTDIPTFDFIDGKKIYGTRITSIDHTQPIIIEGIHALNPKLTEGIPDDQKFRIYISPLTQLNIDNHHRVPTTDARIFRRLVRDHQFRGRSAKSTIHDWPSVRRGEEKWIFPFNGTADAFFNSSMIYELTALKKYAAPLLDEITEADDEYAEAQRLKGFLDLFEEIDDDSAIPNNSIMREFIGGSILVH